MKKERIKAEILDRLTGPAALCLNRLYRCDGALFDELKEIRVRVNRPILLVGFSRESAAAYAPTAEEISSLLQGLCRSSLYAFSESIKEGFLTIEGGHRIGIAGRYLPDRGICDAASLNIRIAGEIKGCADPVMPMIRRGAHDIYNTLILSPPCCGKTTLLRDIARSLSRDGFNIGVIDERSEIAGCCRGVPANDLGPRCDVYDGCPKSTGITMMLRAMSPDVIVTDEIGGIPDMEALRQASRAGIRLVATCHGFGETDLRGGPLRDIFEKTVVLSSKRGPGTVERIV